MDDLRIDEPAQNTGQRMASNRSAPATTCATCGGDRFVVVALRAPVQTPWMKAHGLKPSIEHGIEEYAPCPDCSPSLDASFHRFDGTPVRTPDAARTRELMRK